MSATKPRHCPISTLLPAFAALPPYAGRGPRGAQDRGAADFPPLPWKLDSAPIWPLYPCPVNQIPVPLKELPVAEELLVIV
jgi:hypothetical protein